MGRLGGLAWAFFGGDDSGPRPGAAEVIAGVFPDVLFRYFNDMPYFLLFFTAGWALFECRVHMPEFSRHWWKLFACALALRAAEALVLRGGSNVAGMDLKELGGLLRRGLFSFQVGFTTFALIGFFERYFGRPSKVGRYFANAAFWVYLVHYDFLNLVALKWVSGWDLNESARAISATLVATGFALVTFELLVRPTPLTLLFGPSPKGKIQSSPSGKTTEG